jgi:hypothetical protein
VSQMKLLNKIVPVTSKAFQSVLSLNNWKQYQINSDSRTNYDEINTVLSQFKNIYYLILLTKQ